MTREFLRCHIERGSGGMGGPGPGHGINLTAHPEVDQVDSILVAAVEENVGGLHIAVDDPRSMSFIEGSGDLSQHSNCCVDILFFGKHCKPVNLERRVTCPTLSPLLQNLAQ